MSPTPGQNSWAQEKAQYGSNHKLRVENQPTNRDKYEQKPVPKPPQGGHLTVTPKKAHIQPAVPLISTVPRDRKKRAVTEPISIPIPLELRKAQKKPSVTHLREKFSSSLVNASQNEEEQQQQQAAKLYADIPGKAQNVLGLGTRRRGTPTPASDQRQGDPLKLISGWPDAEALPASTVSLGQVHSSDDAPQVGWEEKNRDPKTALKDQTAKPLHEKEVKDVEYRFQLPRIPNLGTVGKVGALHPGPLNSNGSFQGIIETVSAGCAEEDVKEGPEHIDNGEFLQPLSYTTNRKDGIWENNPAVGYTLPPFTSLGKEKPVDIGRVSQIGPQVPENDGEYEIRQQSQDVLGQNGAGEHQDGWNRNDSQHGRIETQYANPDPYRQGTLRPLHLSENSWATHSQANSLLSPSQPISALLPSEWHSRPATTSVPSPPVNEHGYQRSSPISASLAHLDLTLHHHIDSAFGLLHRHITEKQDFVVDRIITRIEEFEDLLKREMREIKDEVRQVKGELSKIKAKSLESKELDDSIHKCLSNLNKHITTLDTYQLRHTTDQCPQHPISARSHEIGNEYIQGFLGKRRTESAHGDLDRGDRVHFSQQGHSRSSSRTGHSDPAGLRSNRSNTSTSQPDFYQSEEGAARRAFFAELGTRRGMMPDLKDHPAYTTIRVGNQIDIDPKTKSQSHGQDPSLPNMELLGDSVWYHKAYGRTGM